MDWLQDFNWVADDSLIDCWNIGLNAGNMQPGDSVFLWTRNKAGNMEGIYGEAKVVPAPAAFTLGTRKKEYYTDSRAVDDASASGSIAVKYIRLCLGVPLLKEEIKAQVALPDIIIERNHPDGKIHPVSEEGCKIILKVLKWQTNMADIQFCRP